ncbi:MAG: hypothetical protein QOG34_1883, partial [Frankiaceae bacterium]|nr:hypothetical protein [Frankiaceae bacterium]
MRARHVHAVAAVTAVITVAGTAATAPGAAAAPSPHPRAHSRALPVGEIASLRTATSRTVRHANGTLTTSVYPQAVNYRTGSGQWQSIDTKLVPRSGPNAGWQNAANSFTTSFAPKAAGTYLTLTTNGKSFAFAADGAASRPARTSGGTITYPGAFTNSDLTYTEHSGGVEETVVLRDRSAPTDFRYTVRAFGAGKVSVHRRADGSWAVSQGPAPDQLFVLEAPRAQDATAGGRSMSPDPLRHATMSAAVRGKTITVDLHVDRAWLADSQRRFPVLVDPTITIQPDTMDASFEANQPTFTPYVSDRVYIGTDDNYAWRGAMKFDLSAVPSGVTVTGASLGMYYDGYCITVAAGCNTSGQQFEAHRMTADWSTTSTAGQVAYDSTVLATVARPSASGWMGWNITSTVQNWLTGAQPNYGLLMKRDVETMGTSGICPPGRAYAGGSIQPKLDITYVSDAVTVNQPDTVHSNGAELNWSKWNPPSGAPFQQYAVYRGTTSGFTPSASTLLTTITDAATTMYRDTTSAPSKSFVYKVVANSSVSNEVSVTTPADGQAVKTLQPGPGVGVDTYMDYASGMTNCATYGADTRIFLGATTGGIYRGLVKFNVGDIPATATVTRATLSLWQAFGQSTATTVEAHRVTRGWNPGTGGANGNYPCTGDGATWYDATGAGSQWTTQGGDYDSTVAASVAKPANQQPGFDNFDISGLAQQWVGGGAPNLGVLLRESAETLAAGNYFAYNGSDFTGDPSLRPKLTVTYTDGSHAVAPSESVAGPGSGSTVAGTATLTAAASDDGAVDHVDFLVDTAVVGTDTTAPYSSTWNSASVVNGSHAVTVRAVDNAGNTSTSSASSVTVDNTAPPAATVTAPAANATLSGTATLTATTTGSSPVKQVQFLVDNQIVGTSTSTASPYTFAWNTKPGSDVSWDGAHTVTALVTDTTGRTASSPAVAVTVANTTGTVYRAGWTSYTAVPPAFTYDPTAVTQLKTSISATFANNSGTAWSSGTKQLNYRWYSTDQTPIVTTGTGVATTSKINGSGTGTLTIPIAPPTLPAGVNSALYNLQVDLYDVTTAAWFADKGNGPITAQVVVTRKGTIGLGLEKYYQYDTKQLGGGMSGLVNLASGNAIVHVSPWDEPGRGLATVLDLTYNGLESHSRSPAGNNWSLAVSSLTRFGQPLDVHPNNADTISGQSNKWVAVVDGDGTLLLFTGTTNANGVTSWTPPAGVHLYLRPTGSTDPNKYWALSRPDNTTFYYTQAGWPTSVVDKNGNALTFTESATPPGDDPGGPGYRITSVTDAGGRSFGVTYYAKGETKNARQRGKVKDITDHAGHVLHLDYYEDGNLLRLTQRGGTNADGSFLSDRTWVFTYLTSNGVGPAWPNATDRVNPDPHTPNEDSQLYSIRDPRGQETILSYYLNSDGPALAGRVKTLTDRAGSTTTYTYDTTAQTTTVAALLSRTTIYTWDGLGRVTNVKDAVGTNTGIAWTADNEVQKVTEPNAAFTTYAYNANGYLTDVTNQEGDHTQLTYTDKALDATDTGTHWSLLATKTAPNGVATTTVGDYQYSFAYDTAGNLTQVTDPQGYRTAYCYNFAVAPACNTANEAGAAGTLHSTTSANGGTTTFASHDANGYPTRITDPLGRVTQLGFSSDGLQLYTQDANHSGASGSDVRSYRTYTDYDSFQRPGRTSSPKSTSLDRGNLIWADTGYDADDNVTSGQDAHFGAQDAGNGAVTTTAYDVMDRATLVTGSDKSADPAGTRVSNVYDAVGRLTSQTAPIGVKSGITKDHTTSWTYDALDRVTAQAQYTVNSAGTVTDTRTTYSCYDTVCNLVTKTAPNANLATAPACPATTVANTTVYGYDKAHRRTSTTDPLGHKRSVTYDADGRVKTSTDAGGSVTTNTYDQRDMLIRSDAPYVHGGRATTTEYGYDGDGNRTKLIPPRAYDAATDKTNVTYYATTYQYDLADQMTRVDLPTAPAGSADAVDAAFVHYGYDADGRQISESLPVTQPTASLVASKAKTIQTLFDPGWVATSKDPATPKVHFDYTAQGWQSSRAPEDSSGTVDTSKQRLWTYYPDGKVSTTSDENGQKTTYGYDADNNLTYSKSAEGVTSPNETPVEAYVDYTGFDQIAATHYRKTGSSNYTGTAYNYDHDGNVNERDDNATQTLASQTTNSAGIPVTWSFTQTAAPDVNLMTYDGADWLATQNDNGTSSSCTNRQRIANTWTAQGWESTRTVSRADSA